MTELQKEFIKTLSKITMKTSEEIEEDFKYKRAHRPCVDVCSSGESFDNFSDNSTPAATKTAILSICKQARSESSDSFTQYCSVSLYALSMAVIDFITRRRLSVFGHIARLTQGTPAHNALHCQVGLASGHSLGRDWRRRPGRRSRARWTDQLRNDTGSVPANLWRQAILTGPWWSDATARAGYAMTTTTTMAGV